MHLLALTEVHIRVILITLLVKACLIMGVLIVKRITLFFKTRATVISFGNMLLHFSSFCRLHADHTFQLCQQYVTGKGNEFNGRSIADHARHELTVVFPDSLHTAFSSLLSGRRTSRISTALVNIRYQLKFYNEDLHTFLLHFNHSYEAARNEFYTSVYELGRFHDELKGYVKGKTLSKDVHDWSQGYFAVFECWAAQHARESLSALHHKVVNPVIELNSRYPGVPFAAKANEKAVICEQAYQKIRLLDASICRKLTDYSWIYRKSLKITALIGSRIISGKKSKQVFLHPGEAIRGRKYGNSEKLVIGLGMVFFALLCFAGGLYIGADKHALAFKSPPPSSTILTVVTPALKQTAVADTSYTSVKTITGLDISKYQGNLLKDIDKLDTLHFIICKATQGNTLVDADFHYNWKRLKASNVVRGAYHFYMYEDEPATQAAHFLNTVGSLQNNDIPLIVDIEEGSITGKADADTLQARLLAFLQAIELRSSRKPIIYTDRYFADTWLRKDTFAVFPLWLAQYSHRPTPILPLTWKKTGHLFWQKSDSFTIDSRRTDFDVFNGDARQFAAFINRYRH